MNCYILFLIFVCLSDQVILSNSINLDIHWEKVPEYAATTKNNIVLGILRKSEKEFDCIININNLNDEDLNYAYGINRLFHRALDVHLCKFSSDNSLILEREVQTQRAIFLARQMQRRTEYEYEQYTTPKKIYDEKIQKKLSQKAFEEVFNAALKGIPGCCSDLFSNENFKKNLHKIIDELQSNKK